MENINEHCHFYLLEKHEIILVGLNSIYFEISIRLYTTICKGLSNNLETYILSSLLTNA